MKQRSILCSLLLLLSSCLHAQSISQHDESITYVSPQVRWMTYVVDWTYPSPANPATSGMNTWGSLLYQFVYLDGSYSNSYETIVGQRTFNGQFQGSYGPTYPFNLVLVTNPQKPTMAQVLGFRWKCKINSTVFWSNPQNFLTDNWISASWSTYWY